MINKVVVSLKLPLYHYILSFKLNFKIGGLSATAEKWFSSIRILRIKVVSS